MTRCLVLVVPLALAGCIAVQAGGAPAPACVPAWSRDFADRLAAEADAMPSGAATREALAQLAELRGVLPRCREPAQK